MPRPSGPSPRGRSAGKKRRKCAIRKRFRIVRINAKTSEEDGDEEAVDGGADGDGRCFALLRRDRAGGQGGEEARGSQGRRQARGEEGSARRRASEEGRPPRRRCPQEG